ncbi:hypothetical protein EW145_g4158, partial [Phellinidium pouzarii]
MSSTLSSRDNYRTDEHGTNKMSSQSDSPNLSPELVDPFRKEIIPVARSQSPMAFRSTTMHGRDDSLAALFSLALSKENEGDPVKQKTLIQNDIMNNNGAPPSNTRKRDFKFWMCIVALMMSSYLIILDMAGIGTALPIIVNDLHGTEFEWVGSAYALASTAFLPLIGALTQ